MSKVMITKGAFTGMIGTAKPSGAVGPVNNRVFLIIVSFDGGSVEVPLDAIRDLDAEITRMEEMIADIDHGIASHYHDHPHLGWTVRRDRGGVALSRLKDIRARAWCEYSALRTLAGRPLPITASAHFLVVSGRDHWLCG